jgi:hypothetical protein
MKDDFQQTGGARADRLPDISIAETENENATKSNGEKKDSKL